MSCRANVNRDGDRFDGVSPGFVLVDESGPLPESINPECCGAPMRMVRVEYSHGLSPEAQRMADSMSPLLLLGPGGEYVREVGPGEFLFVPKGVGVTVLHTDGGPSICQAVGETARKSSAYFEGLCMGIGIGMVVLAVLSWLVR